MSNRAILDAPERPVTGLHFTVEPPGRAAARLANLGDDQLCQVACTLRETAAALRGVHGCDGFNLLINDGRHDNQSVGEVPEQDERLRFHMIGRRSDEKMAPITVLYAPDDFPLPPIPEAERLRRVRQLQDPANEITGEPTPDEVAEDVEAARAPSTGSPVTGSSVTGDAVSDAAVLGNENAAARAPSDAPCSLCESDQTEVLRNGTARVLRPLRPLIPASVQLVPVRHVVRVTALTDDEFVGLFRLFGRVVATFGQVHGSTSFNLSVNEGKVAGQHTPHVQVHVLGRSADEETDPYQLLSGMRYTLGR